MVLQPAHLRRLSLLVHFGQLETWESLAAIGMGLNSMKSYETLAVEGCFRRKVVIRGALKLDASTVVSSVMSTVVWMLNKSCT